jgi:hypothetical protein
MITPLKCIIQLNKTNQNEIQDERVLYRCQLIENTAHLLMSYSKQNLDANLIKKKLFVPNPVERDLCDLVQQTAELLELQAE